MVMGFIHHMFRYFVPPKPPPATNDVELIPLNIPYLQQNYIPVLGETGQPVAYALRPNIVAQSVNLYQATFSATGTAATVPVPVLKQPTVNSLAAPINPLHAPTKIVAESSSTADWDGWPDGDFERDFTYKEFHATKDLMTHWATVKRGGDRTGHDNSDDWQGGKRSWSTCLGILTCDNPNCEIAVRPKTKGGPRQEQLDTPCTCGAQLIHHRCSVQLITYTWSGGVHLKHEGTHHHRRPPRVLHLSRQEQEEFREMVIQHPDTGPAGLLAGIPGLERPGKSAADISPALLNVDRISKERLNIVHGAHGGGGDGSFIKSFAKLEKDLGDFLVFHTFGSVTVICLQSSFMLSQLVREQPLDEPINGTVNDAAHGWWRDRDFLLMVTSVYSLILRRWVPGLFSFTNGATIMHYMYHFLVLFERMAIEATKRAIPVSDKLFVGVMDFSDAEREGFIDAFVRFWQGRDDDTRTEVALREAVAVIFRGCEEHFRAQLTRISRSGAIIPVDFRDSFIRRAKALLDVLTTDEFLALARQLVRDFPNIAGWMEWWLRPEHASMLFLSQRKMDPEIWDAIPATTNAEEAMHWKLYRDVGRDHTLFHGFYSLYSVALKYERLYNAAKQGVPINYGEQEVWKVVAEKIGRTKPSRANTATRKRKRNDGRPPDTVQELVLGKTKKQQKLNDKVKKFLRISGLPGCPWEANSCWLDSSIELLHVAFCDNNIFTEFTSFCEEDNILSESSLRQLHSLLDWRRKVDLTSEGISKELGTRRNDLRVALKNEGAIESVNGFESNFCWLWDPLERKKFVGGQDISYRLSSYFEFLTLEIHRCSGCLETGGRHLEIWNQPRRKRIHQIPISAHARLKGDVGQWFREFVAIPTVPVPQNRCWRIDREDMNIVFCSGERGDIRGLVLSISTILVIEVSELADISLDPESPAADPPRWVFPPKLTPLTAKLERDEGLVYDLIGLSLFSQAKQHFIARYYRDGVIYNYDGQKNSGYATKESGTRSRNRIAGKTAKFPPTFKPWAAVYVLRGGSKAQDVFYNHRKALLEQEFDLKFSSKTLAGFPSVSYCGDDLIELPAAERFWLSAPLKAKLTEYVTAKPSPSSSSTPEPSHPTNATRPDSVKEQEDSTSGESPIPPESEEKQSTQRPTSSSSSTSSSSGADSDFEVDCRCGVHGDGNAFYDGQLYGAAVQCDSCKHWSHQACQRDGRASTLRSKDPFTCDKCEGTILEQMFKLKADSVDAQRVSERKRLESRTRFRLPLKQRLLPGRGALARRGEFYYPVRLIHYQSETGMWRVRWWWKCLYCEGSVEDEPVSDIPVSDLVDSLWGDRTGRRAIRLGKWTHANQVPGVEDRLSDPASVPYTAEVNDALLPYRDLLRALLSKPHTLEDAIIPSKSWVEASGLNLETADVYYAGNLSLKDRAEVNNWFEIHVGIKKNTRIRWVGRVPLAHALTLLIAHRLRKTPPRKLDINDEKAVLMEAWRMQHQLSADSVWDEVDVEKECLERLEEEMFERSALAGIAGNCQWGLDAGDHQDAHDPYAGTPEYWYHGDRDESEGELEHGPAYIAVIKDPQPQVPRKAQPRPRLKAKTLQGKKT